MFIKAIILDTSPPQQQNILFPSLLFPSKEQILEGRKKMVYVLVKILKGLTGSTAQSFHCKFAWNEVLTNRHTRRVTDIDESELGIALQEVIKHRTIRGKFNSVHPDLRAQRITRLEVREDGIFFHRDDQLATRQQLEDEAKQTSVSQIAAWTRRLGSAAFNTQNYPLALLHYEKSVNCDPESLDAWTSFASTLSETNALIEVHIL